MEALAHHFAVLGLKPFDPGMPEFAVVSLANHTTPPTKLQNRNVSLEMDACGWPKNLYNGLYTPESHGHEHEH